MDKRSKKIAVIAHCILNQNSRVLGLAKRKSAITEIIEFLIQQDIGIIQMPCPELLYAGILRKEKTRDQYDNAIFRRHCRKIAKEIVNQIQEYKKREIITKIVIGVDGSPSCGVNVALTEGSRRKEKGFGILMEELYTALKEKGISIPFYGIRSERLPKDLVMIEKLLKAQN